MFPCFFGAALKLEGVDPLLESLERLTQPLPPREELGARVFKVTRDSSGAWLTWLKVTGGELKVKAELSPGRTPGGLGAARRTSCGFTPVPSSSWWIQPCPGTWRQWWAFRPYPGEGLGFEKDATPPALEPVLRYRVLLPQGCDVHTALGYLRELEQEDPLLHVVWDERLGQVHLQLMGEVQLEVLQRLIAQRFGMEVQFDAGQITYKETIAAPVEGVGHYEPLCHYAEVHLLLEPLPQGSGLQFRTRCREDDLDRNWQRLVLTHLEEKTHLAY